MGYLKMRYRFTNIFLHDGRGIYTIEINSSRYVEKYMVFDMNNKNIFKTNSREEMKMTLDLMGLRIKQVNIFMIEYSTGRINVKYSLIDLNVK